MGKPNTAVELWPLYLPAGRGTGSEMRLVATSTGIVPGAFYNGSILVGWFDFEKREWHITSMANSFLESNYASLNTPGILETNQQNWLDGTTVKGELHGGAKVAGARGVHAAEGAYSAARDAFVARSTLPVYRRQLFPDPVFGERPAATGTTIFETDAVRMWHLGDDVAILGGLLQDRPFPIIHPVQGSIGFGLGVLSVPLLVLIDARFVPGPLLLAALLLTLLIYRRERQSVQSGELGWAYAGRVAGTVLGYLALRSRSFLWGALLHWSVGITMDAFVIGREIGWAAMARALF